MTGGCEQSFQVWAVAKGMAHSLTKPNGFVLYGFSRQGSAPYSQRRRIILQCVFNERKKIEWLLIWHFNLSKERNKDCPLLY